MYTVMALKKSDTEGRGGGGDVGNRVSGTKPSRWSCSPDPVTPLTGFDGFYSVKERKASAHVPQHYEYG